MGVIAKGIPRGYHGENSNPCLPILFSINTLSPTVSIHTHTHRSLPGYISISMHFFPQVTPHFLVSMIHQVIWPSPGTLPQASSMY